MSELNFTNKENFLAVLSILLEEGYEVVSYKEDNLYIIKCILHGILETFVLEDETHTLYSKEELDELLDGARKEAKQCLN